MSKQSIESQIAEFAQAIADKDFVTAQPIHAALLERRLKPEQRQRIADLVDSMPEPESGEEEGKPSQAKQLAKYKARYHRSHTSEGNASLNNGDDMAGFLEGMDWIAVCKLADAFLPLDGQTHAEKYERLNPGSKRMNAGNKLRAAWKRGDIQITDSGIVAA